MRKDMKRKNDRLVALLGAVLCACACQEGCERKETVSPEPSATNASAVSAAPVVSNAPSERQVDSRANDAAYQAWLRCRDAEKRLNHEREKIRARMEEMRERARGRLPKGATDAQVTAEIENNPRRYPAWRELEMALMKIDEECKRNKKATSTTIRKRIQREAAGQNSAKQ